MIEFRPKIIHCFAATSSLSTNCLAAMRSPAVSLFPHERNPGLQRYRIQNIETAASLNCATLRSGMELRSESRNASLARTAPLVEMSQVGHHSGPQQNANWQKPAGKTTARACPAPVPPAYPPSQWAPLIPYRKVTIRTKRGKQFVAAVNPGAVPHSREQSSGSDFSGKQRQYARPHVAVAG